MGWIVATVCLAVLCVALAGAWAWDRMALVRALRLLARDVERAVEMGPDAVLRRPDRRALDPLVEAERRVLDAWAEARRDRVKAMTAATARAERTIGRLEAILRDLSEGVLVCSLEHEIQLYNRAALWLADAPDRLGLGRSLFDLFEAGPVRATLGDLLAEEAADDAAGHTRSLDLASPGGARYRARMAIVRDAGQGPSGYVLTIGERLGDPATRPGMPPRQPRPRTAGSASGPDGPRPEFYDFDFEPAQLARDRIRDQKLSDLTYVVFDTETTGLRPTDGDGLVSIGAVRIIGNRLLSGETFETLVDPGRPIPPASTRFHGITDAMVAGAPPAPAAVAAFKRFAGDAVLVAHNAAFDLRFLTLQETAAGVRFDNAVLDTLFLSVWLEGEAEDHSLDAIALRYGVAGSARHTALGDATTTAEVFLRQLERLAARDIATFGHAVDVADMALQLRRMERHF